MNPTLEPSGEPLGRVDLSSTGSLVQQVYDLVWYDLVTWTHRPADILVEERLAHKFGTSRTPVREALRRLADEGFLRVVPRKGYVVLPLTLADVHEALDVRLLLEPEAAALAARRLSAEVSERLERGWTEFESALGREEDQLNATRAHVLSAGIHVQIGHASGNRRLGNTIEALVKETIRETYHPKATGNRDFVVQTHRVILDAVLSKDPVEARAASTRHIEDHRARLLEAIISEPGVVSGDEEMRSFVGIGQYH